MFRYSQIIGEAFYRIGLSKDQYSLVDAFFLAAAHHRIRAQEADDLRNSQFHQRFYWQHLKAMYAVIRRGEFGEAKDLSHRGMNNPDAWNPYKLPSCVAVLTDLDQTALPHPNMFQAMACDIRYELGDNHPYDELLESPGARPMDFSLSYDQKLAA